MHDTVVIVTGSEPLDAIARAAVPDDAIVIAADGGLDHALAAGLRPAMLVGDLDSVSSDSLAWAEGRIDIRRHEVDKDLTDTELAVSVAADLHPERLMVIAGGGDRLDHTFAAIGALGNDVVTGVPVVELYWAGQYARVLHGPARTTLAFEPGTRISLLALHGSCRDVVVHGTRWELTGEDLAPLSGRGVSNEVTSPRVRIEHSAGVLTVFADPPRPVQDRATHTPEPDRDPGRDGQPEEPRP